MKKTLVRLVPPLVFCIAAAPWSHAQETVSLMKTTESIAPVSTARSAGSSDTATFEFAAKRNQQESLEIENRLQAERLTNETSQMRAEITRLKMERELMTEKLALEAAKRQAAIAGETAKLETEKEKLIRDGELSKVRADKLAYELKALQGESALQITRLQNEITTIETFKKRAEYSDSKPIYLDNPLREDGTLVVSDRRIPLNGLITTQTADYVTSRIQYWNNKDREMPIFIIIDASPGGSVMAGYRILKAMDSSSAPVHVVVKSLAASMAAAITTLAVESYAYPNAVILHHQISSQMMGQLNLTQQREFHEESQRWWTRFGTPIADKMGITTDELIKQMYKHSSSGDWSEFGEDAQKLKWVNHIVQGIEETSIIRDPDAAPASSERSAVDAHVDANGKPFTWLPRLDPKDVYFLYNPDQYFRLR